jgi:hypothetical protein
METPEQEWPTYPIGPRDSLFAIGVVSTKFTELESIFRFMFSTIFSFSTDDGNMIYAKIGNEAAVDLARRRLVITTWPKHARDDVAHFLKAFEICKANRDGLMHASLAWHSQNIYLMKNTKSGKTQIASPTIDELRETANSINKFIEYGSNLGNAINNMFVEGPIPVFPASAFPWPDRPPLPHNLGYTSDPLPARQTP